MPQTGTRLGEIRRTVHPSTIFLDSVCNPYLLIGVEALGVKSPLELNAFDGGV